DGDTSEVGVLYDALWNEELCLRLFDVMARRKPIDGTTGKLIGSTTKALKTFRPLMESRMHAAVLDGRTHNTCITFRNESGLILFLLKAFRHIDIGLNPELEMGMFLTDGSTLEVAPPVAGWIEFKNGDNQDINLGVLQGYIYNEGDAWQYTLDAIGDYFERVLVAGPDSTKLPAAKT